MKGRSVSCKEWTLSSESQSDATKGFDGEKESGGKERTTGTEERKEMSL
jgi:hypothetical protein